MKQGRCSLLSQTNRKGNPFATAAILHRHDQRNSANDSFSSKRHYSVQRKHGSYLSFPSKNRYCFFDATGSVLLGDKSCYVYEIVVRHPNQGNPPLAVASYFTTSHNIPSISYFLQSFCHAESTLYRKRSLPKLLMCDGSTALMNAIVLSMFKETFKNSLHRCCLIASGKYTSSFCELPILNLCMCYQ